jgi:lipoate-protein ligase A
MLTGQDPEAKTYPGLAISVDKTWLLLESGPGKAPYNMALDEALLTAMPRLGVAVLRFYSWTEPAASFGYFQRYSDVERVTLLRPLVRRPTGGGVVPHDFDWTYSLVFPVRHEWFSLAASESYRRIHEWIRAAFSILDIQTELAADAHKTLPGQCFAGHEKADLLWHGKKIAGAAQRRTRAGLLIQGSVQCPLAVPRTYWQKAMCSVVHSQQGVEWRDLGSSSPVFKEALVLAQEKYSQASYNCKR